VKDSGEVTVIHVGTIVTLLFALTTNETFPETLRASIARNIADRMGAEPTPTPAPTPAPTPTSPQSCLRAGIPDPNKPVLTDAQVVAIVRGKVQLTGETTNGTTVCVWSRTIPHVTNGSTPANGTLTWQVAIDGPLASTAAAHQAYVAGSQGAAVSVVVPNLGDEAELAPLAGTTSGRLLVQAGKYFLQFDSVNAPAETETGILLALAETVLVGLKLTPASSPETIARKSWSTDWAGPSFCEDYDQPYLKATFRGVASCGVPYVAGETTNLTGAVCYPVSHPAPGTCKSSKDVVFNVTGFQCVEYVLRYFYFMTGIRTTRLDDNGDDVATELYYAFHAKNPQLGLDPLTSKKKAKGLTVGTSKYKPSLVKGDIISMWSADDEAGHVAVVQKVTVHKNSNGTYSGQITMVNENAQHGITPINVTNSRLTYGGGYFTTFQWLTGLPTS
jgi:CHAP domain